MGASGLVVGGSGAEVVKVPGVLIVKLDGALHFANAGAMQRALERIDKFSHAHAHPASTPRPFFQQQATATAATATTAANMATHQAHPLAQPQPQHSPSKKGRGSAPHAASTSLQQPHFSPSPPAVSAPSSLPHPCVILDLSDCTSVDSTAVLTLLSIMNQYATRGLTLLLVMQRASLHDRIVRAAGADRYATGVFRQLSSAVDYAQNEAQLVEPEQTAARVAGYESFGPASR